MKLSLIVSLLVAASFACYGQQATPKINSVDPDSGKRGDVVTATGENLGKDIVAKLYLTDGEPKNDVQVEISEQTATTIKFKIPAKAASGRLALMILTAGKQPTLIEQPVKISVDETAAQ